MNQWYLYISQHSRLLTLTLILFLFTFGCWQREMAVSCQKKEEEKKKKSGVAGHARFAADLLSWSPYCDVMWSTEVTEKKK